MSEAELVDQNHSNRIIESEFLHSHIFGNDSPRVQISKNETIAQSEKNSSSPKGDVNRQRSKVKFLEAKPKNKLRALGTTSSTKLKVRTNDKPLNTRDHYEERTCTDDVTSTGDETFAI